MMKRLLWSAVLVPVLAGCYLFGTHEGHSEELSYAYYETTCGPTDGPAMTIHLTEEQATCERLHEIHYNAPELEHVRLDVYGINQPEPGHSQPIGPLVAGPLEGGWARKCPGSGVACIPVVSGGVAFGETDRGEATVEVNLVFEEDHRVKGRFPLQQCEARISFCG